MARLQRQLHLARACPTIVDYGEPEPLTLSYRDKLVVADYMIRWHQSFENTMARLIVRAWKSYKRNHPIA